MVLSRRAWERDYLPDPRLFINQIVPGGRLVDAALILGKCADGRWYSGFDTIRRQYLRKGVLIIE
jgi:hypothetical protein